MLRLGHQGRTRIVASLGSRNVAHATFTARPRLFSSTTNTQSKSTSRPSAAWYLGAGLVFSGMTLLIQAPSLGLVSEHRNYIHNDSKSGPPPPGGDSIGAKLAAAFRKKPATIDQADIVLDGDLTVTSWKQQEQAGLIDTPGIMLWGSNKNGLIDPTGKSAGVISIPQRLTAFQGKILRDLKLGDDVAAAVDDQGNVYQWGTGFNKESHEPEITLRNRDIQQVALCDSKLFGLSKDGTHIYVLPKVRPTSGPSKAAIEYEQHKPSKWRYVGLGGQQAHDLMTQLPLQEVLHAGETITSMASGKNHMLMVTSSGRVFSSEDGLSVSAVGSPEFRQAKIVEVACGEVHSLARDDQGRCWAWGVNGFGQLAQGAYSHSNLKLALPTLIKSEGECVKIAAGGQTSYFVLKEKDSFKVKSAGMGQWGQLGDDTYTHIQGSLVTVAPLSNLAEYKESEKKLAPIGIHSFAIGSTHAFAVIDNAVTEDRISMEGDRKTNEVVVVHGRDVFAWGQNTYYQLLTGKRTNKTEPVHALPLDSDKLQTADKLVAAVAKGSSPSSSTDLDATNRLQLMPSLPKKSADGTVRILEVKIVAGNGLSGVYCGEGSAIPVPK
ncbi:hypothetical protein BGZ83_006903 [Gryganskiella cystojenkinii]|nr:hypothetical protein BGZ83_006903 [Gryganskiella cystojenkinii]